MCERVCTLVEQSEVFSLESVYVCESVSYPRLSVCVDSLIAMLLATYCTGFVPVTCWQTGLCVCVMVE